MGFQKKTGKGRIDKWYKLAKEKGYRARAAFKLIQLNRKYGFLERSRVLLDLCAAPGSWCQVAAETMPAKNSLILGVDLASIKPIARATTFQGDITTDKCRTTLRQHLKTLKVDTVLHDGAPNVGTAWVQDAFSQAELVLQALKLATEFLVEGGVFVTKVFRSRDYNALLWVLGQLFSKVDATKPPSSRNVSAEIFVVCQGFKAPKKIDPRFLDAKAVFAELSEPAGNNEAKVFNPEKKKRKRGGYEEGEYIQFKEVSASNFVQAPDPIAMLASLNRITFDQKENGDIALAALDKLPETTEEVRQCCSDLMVLGRKEFKILLKWRLKCRVIFGFKTKDSPAETTDDREDITTVTPMDEELKIQEELEQLNDKEAGRRKRERRRENEKKQKEITRMQLHMTTPTEIGLEQDGVCGRDSVFQLKQVDKAGAVDEIAKGRMGVAVPAQPAEESVSSEAEDSEEDNLDGELESMYNQYQERRAQTDTRYWSKKTRTASEDADFEGFSNEEKHESDEDNVDLDSEDDRSDGEDETSDHLIFKKPEDVTQASGLTMREAMFFEQDIFKQIGGLDIESDPDSAVDMGSDSLWDRAMSIKKTLDEEKISSVRNKERTATSSNTSSAQASVLQHDQKAHEQETTSWAFEEKEQKDVSYEIVKRQTSDWEAESEPRKDGRLDIDIITAEAMTLAQQIASGQKTTQDLVDEGFNKYTFRDTDGLPEWFLDDETKHSRPHRPISAAGAAAIKEKLRAMNARPIKKVREAKDRKKFKTAQKLEKLRKKSALMVEDDGMSEKDKAANIVKLMKRAGKKKPKQQVKLVVAKNQNKGIRGRPRGVKGKYKIVDSRLKKDARAEKRLAKKSKR
ncbi:uncharacterized protein KY384_004844 [Bacidia gigantensis]|uniref:uncharacterized protein n=1 Tax=Bacidia gigantensis TaxID=2732470 RepID=UPI001D04F69B|nr:uncharacterized protein KY384_004844 [Bacidia gigantensis]KAG8530342.1 hypothetical protein KY384_004844 [Bacidia gigantensis]